MTVRVVAAALNISGAIITQPPPARHHNLIYWVCRYMAEAIPVTQGEQGFLLSDGRFVGRFEARKVAEEADQVTRGGAPDQRLYSEDLW